MKIKTYIFFIFLLCASVSAQKVSTSIDTTKNRIGAQFNLTLKTSTDTTANVVFPVGKMFGGLEVIRSYAVDTIKKNNTLELIKKYGLTQFDSGKFTIPKLKVLINNKPFLTDSLSIEITGVKVDTLKRKMYDIKDIVTTGKQQDDWWKYVLFALAIAGIGLVVYRFVKKKQLAKGELELFKSPIERATGLLQQLEKKELWQKGEIKNYYSELTDIARNYIEEAIHIPAMESTTSELIAGLRNIALQKKMTLTPETVENLEKVLRQADLVKFAKSQPLDYEIADDRSKIERAIFTLDESIPEETEDVAAFNEIQKKKLLQKQKRNRIVITIGAVMFLLVATTLFFVATKGFDYVKDNLIGHPTKDLLEGEWVSSEYGNPSVYIETPKVLKRTDANEQIPKEAMDMLKEFQMFGYGAILDQFFVLVSTNKYKDEVQLDLSKALEGIINTMELRGARNIILKQEEYETTDGISGIKAYGTMTQVDPVSKESIKVYYDIMIFGHENGLQQILVVHKEGDEYGKKISERVLRSVELKTTSE